MKCEIMFCIYFETSVKKLKNKKKSTCCIYLSEFII